MEGYALYADGTLVHLGLDGETTTDQAPPPSPSPPTEQQ